MVLSGYKLVERRYASQEQRERQEPPFDKRQSLNPKSYLHLTLTLRQINEFQLLLIPRYRQRSTIIAIYTARPQ